MSSYCNGQDHSNDTLFNKFRNDILIEQKEYGRVMWDDETTESYYRLLSTHSIEELIKYTSDSIPAVRTHIFVGLAQKNADKNLLGEISNRHLNDTATFAEGSTDVVIRWSVHEYMQLIMDHQGENKLVGIDHYKRRFEKIRNERYVFVPGVHHGIITKDALLSIDSLTSRREFKIVSFILSVAENTMMSSSGNVLTEEMKRSIRELRSGERIHFEAIKAEGPDKTVRNLLPISLKIK